MVRLASALRVGGGDRGLSIGLRCAGVLAYWQAFQLRVDCCAFEAGPGVIDGAVGHSAQALRVMLNPYPPWCSREHQDLRDRSIVP